MSHSHRRTDPAAAAYWRRRWGTSPAALAPADHAYSPSTCPSVDGQGCLYRPRLADGTYSRLTCQRPQRVHPR